MSVQAKLTLFACIVACLFSVAIPLVSEASYKEPSLPRITTSEEPPITAALPTPSETTHETEPTTTEGASSPPVTDTEGENAAPSPSTLSVYLHREDRVVTVSYEEYIVSVVAAEMPYTFHLEALKAQAVAARTYCLYKQKGGLSHENGADVCTDSSHCAAYVSEKELTERYGNEVAARILGKVREAVEATSGQILIYGGEPILAVFHSRSYRRTESSKNIWGGDLPYLVSVPTGEEDSISTVLITTTQLASLFRAEAVEVGQGSSSLTLHSDKTDTGRQARLYYGTRVLPAKSLRTHLGLRSCDFTYEATDDGWLFTVHGYGHGVGMSQYGANHMAREGATYDAILTHYYTGVTLASMT